MKIDLSDGVQDIRARRQSTIRRPLSVAGKQDRHLGPRWEYAEIELVAEPADAWDVQVSLPEEDRVSRWREIIRIGLKVTAARYTFESSRRAFRMAGRNAAEALLNAAEIV